jgi:hypothetical protein
VVSPRQGNHRKPDDQDDDAKARVLVMTAHRRCMHRADALSDPDDSDDAQNDADGEAKPHGHPILVLLEILLTAGT